MSDDQERNVESALSGGLNARGMSFKEVIKFVSGFAVGAAGAPDIGIDCHHAGFFRGLLTRATTDAHGAINQGQLVVLLEKNDQAVAQLNPPWLLRFELMQRRNGNFVPGFSNRAGSGW